jgi:Tol biopolymer transport system component
MKHLLKTLGVLVLLTCLPLAAIGGESKIAYMISGTQRYIGVVDDDGLNATKVYQPPKFTPYSMQPSWSPDGDHLAFTFASTLYRIPADRLTVYPDGYEVAPGAGSFWDGESMVAYNGLSSAAWAPAGGRIAVKTGTPQSVCWIDEWGGGNMELLYMPTGGETLHRGRLAWNSDGTKLAFFVVLENGDHDLVILDLLQGGLTRITAASVGVPPDWAEPDWARQGDARIAFCQGEWVHTLNTDTGEVVEQVVGVGYPTWSPDNTKITVRMGHGKIRSYDLFTGEWQRLANGSFPDWSRLIAEPECIVDEDCDAGICCGGSCFVPCTGDGDCDDSDSCTIDSCVNSGTCDAYCEHSPDPACCIPTHSKEKGPRCSDGLDNDCDGLVDGADPDC